MVCCYDIHIERNSLRGGDNMFDKGLLELLERNPNKAMTYIIEQFTPLVFTIVRNKLSSICSIEDMEEVVSDVFVSVYNQRVDIDFSKGSISAYIARIARNKAVDKLRKCYKPNDISIDDDESFLELADDFNIEDSVERQELSNNLIKAIKQLGEPDSTIVYSRYYLGQSPKEISKITGLTYDNVRQKLSRALKKLEIILKGELYENIN